MTTRHIIKQLFTPLLILLALVTISKTFAAQTATPIPAPTPKYNGRSVSGERFIYVDDSHDEYPKGASSGTFRLLSEDYKWPSADSAGMQQLIKEIDTSVNVVNKLYNSHYEVAVTVNADLTVLTVKYEHPNSYYPKEKILPAMGKYFHAHMVSVWPYPSFEPAGMYYRGPWAITEYQTKRGKDYLVDSKHSSDYRAEIWEGLWKKIGKHYLSITFTRFDMSSGALIGPIQDIRILMGKNGVPQLEYVKWYYRDPCACTTPPYVKPVDWWGTELQKYAGDLPEPLRKYFTPAVVAQIKAAAAIVKRKP